MIVFLEKLTLKVFSRLEHGFDQIFGPHWNPWYQLGSLSFYLFLLVIFSGIYLFIFFDTSIIQAYLSVEDITHRQWYLGGVLRSIHRYASDLMAVTVTLHVLREFSLGRFRGARWFSWFSGIPLLWLLFASAIGGYWLVWDQLAQYIAVASSEWIDALPVMTDPFARNFVSNETLSDRLFSLLVFMHIALPLFLLIGIFIHIKRMKQPQTRPPRGLAVGVTLSLLVLCLVKPAVSMKQADLSTAVASVDLDWFYMNVYPLLDSWGPGWLWVLLVGGSGALALLPWLSPDKAMKRNVAVVNPANCNGCSWCYQDCPHEAITMVEHDFKKGHRQALVDPELCTACGICAGACPSATPFRHVDELISGIEVPSFSVERLRQDTERRIAALKGEGKVILFGCDHALAVETLAADNLAVLQLPCIGQLPPSFVDYVAGKDNVDAVVVSGCHPPDCFFRLGSRWSEERLHGERLPHLRTRSNNRKITLAWAGRQDGPRLRQAIQQLREQLAAPVVAGRAEE